MSLLADASDVLDTAAYWWIGEHRTADLAAFLEAATEAHERALQSIVAER